MSESPFQGEKLVWIAPRVVPVTSDRFIDPIRAASFSNGWISIINNYIFTYPVAIGRRVAARKSPFEFFARIENDGAVLSRLCPSAFVCLAVSFSRYDIETRRK